MAAVSTVLASFAVWTDKKFPHSKSVFSDPSMRLTWDLSADSAEKVYCSVFFVSMLKEINNIHIITTTSFGRFEKNLNLHVNAHMHCSQ